MHLDVWSAIFYVYNWLGVSGLCFGPEADHAIQKQVGHNQDCPLAHIRKLKPEDEFSGWENHRRR